MTNKSIFPDHDAPWDAERIARFNAGQKAARTGKRIPRDRIAARIHRAQRPVNRFGVMAR